MASTTPDALPGAPGSAAYAAAQATGALDVDATETETATHGIESHGIDHIPDADRHGRARSLFSVWAAANVNYLSLVVGGALVMMGLTLVQAMAVIVVGNLFWLLAGVLAVSGPASGTPSEVITRAIYGIRGNRVNNAVTGWMISVCYFALNLAAAATAAFALVAKTGITVDDPVKVVVVVAIAVVTLTISVYGHAAIMRLYLPITLALTAAFAVVLVAVLRHADYGYKPQTHLTGTALWAVLLGGVALIASGPLSYTTSADFSRYLPRTTSSTSVALWTALGGFVPGVLVCGIGAFAATAVDMTDPQNSLQTILPGWFAPIFLGAIVLGTISINALTAYSAGLALQAVGVKVRRSLSVLVDGTVSVSLTLYALLVSNFLDTVSNVLELTIVLLGPSMTVYAVDIWLRRNTYDGLALTDESRGSTFWYTGGVNWAGAAAVLTGAAAAALCVDTTMFTGPIAHTLDGIDLSLPVGIVVSAVVYAALMRPRLRVRPATA